MANQNTPMGLSAVRRKDSAQWDNTVQPVFVAAAQANALATGDVVSLVSGVAAPSGAYAGVDLSNLGTGSGNAVVAYGVVEGFLGSLAANTVGIPNFWNSVGTNPSGNMARPAATNQDYYALVSTDHNILYAVQVSNTDVLPNTAIGKTANLQYGAPNAFTGVSGTTLAANSVATTGGEVVIYGFEQTKNNDPTKPYAKVLVYFNPAVETGI